MQLAYLKQTQIYSVNITDTYLREWERKPDIMMIGVTISSHQDQLIKSRLQFFKSVSTKIDIILRERLLVISGYHCQRERLVHAAGCAVKT